MTGGKKVDRRRNDLREEILMEVSLMGGIVRSRMIWTGHLVWIED